MYQIYCKNLRTIDNRSLPISIINIDYLPIAAWLYAYCIDLEVWLFSIHGSDYCHFKWRWDHLHKPKCLLSKFSSSTWKIRSLIFSIILGTIMTISKDRVKPSPQPDSWKLKEIFATGVVLGSYLAIMTVVFFWLMRKTDFFSVWAVIQTWP